MATIETDTFHDRILSQVSKMVDETVEAVHRAEKIKKARQKFNELTLPKDTPLVEKFVMVLRAFSDLQIATKELPEVETSPRELCHYTCAVSFISYFVTHAHGRRRDENFAKIFSKSIAQAITFAENPAEWGSDHFTALGEYLNFSISMGGDKYCLLPLASEYCDRARSLVLKDVAEDDLRERSAEVSAAFVRAIALNALKHGKDSLFVKHFALTSSVFFIAKVLMDSGDEKLVRLAGQVLCAGMAHCSEILGVESPEGNALRKVNQDLDILEELCRGVHHDDVDGIREPMIERIQTWFAGNPDATTCDAAKTWAFLGAR